MTSPGAYQPLYAGPSFTSQHNDGSFPSVSTTKPQPPRLIPAPGAGMFSALWTGPSGQHFCLAEGPGCGTWSPARASGWLRVVMVRNLACFRRGLCWDLRQTLDVRPEQRVSIADFCRGIRVSTKLVTGRFDQCGELGVCSKGPFLSGTEAVKDLAELLMIYQAVRICRVLLGLHKEKTWRPFQDSSLNLFPSAFWPPLSICLTAIFTIDEAAFSCLPMSAF